MANKDNKRGFSGLSDLASDVSGVDDVTSPEASSPPPLPSKPTTTHTASNETEHKTPCSPQRIEPAGSGKSGGGSGWKWIFAIIAVFFVIWLANNWEQITQKTSYNPPPPAQSYNLPQSKRTPVPQPSKSQSTELRYEKPPVGTNRVLSVTQIRWCLREKIRLESMENFIDTNFGVEEFNKIVNSYNRRCGNYRYSQGSLKRAQRDVKADRSQIVAKAIEDAGKLSGTSLPKSPSVSPGKSTNSVSKRPNPQLTREAQSLLAALGYDPGPVDGLFGVRTANAVKAFQRDAGLSQDGRIDEDLLLFLRNAKAANLKVENQRTPQQEQSDRHVFNQPSQALPMNGWIQNYYSGEPIAPLRLITRTAEHHYFVKIEDYYTGQSLLTVFVRGGASVDLDVPLGSYKLKYAIGKTWYGTDFLSDRKPPTVRRISDSIFWSRGIKCQDTQLNCTCRETEIFKCHKYQHLISKGIGKTKYDYDYEAVAHLFF